MPNFIPIRFETAEQRHRFSANIVVYIFKIYRRHTFFALLCFKCFSLLTYIILCNTGAVDTWLLKAAWLNKKNKFFWWTWYQLIDLGWPWVPSDRCVCCCCSVAVYLLMADADGLLQGMWYIMQMLRTHFTNTVQLVLHCILLPSILHWLKAPERIAFKYAVFVYKCLHGSASAYLTDELCQVADVEARRRLRFSSSSSLIVSRTRLSTVGDRAFPVAAARVRNSLPDLVTSAPSIAVFRSRLTTHLFDISLWLYSAPYSILTYLQRFPRPSI